MVTELGLWIAGHVRYYYLYKKPFALFWRNYRRTTLELRPDVALESGEFVVMPDHVHAVLIIGENKYNEKTSCFQFDLPNQ